MQVRSTDADNQVLPGAYVEIKQKHVAWSQSLQAVSAFLLGGAETKMEFAE